MRNVGDYNVLKKLLSQSRQQEPSPHFTENVMREIEAMAADRVYADADLLILLKKSTTAAPSTRFTYSVLKKIHRPPAALYEPVINARTWKLIVAFLLTTVVVEVSNPSTSGGPAFFSNPVAEYLGDVFVTFHESFFYFGIAAVSGCGLLLLDSFLKRALKTESDGSHL